jgi:hypothetical protein
MGHGNSLNSRPETVELSVIHVFGQDLAVQYPFLILQKRQKFRLC